MMDFQTSPLKHEGKKNINPFTVELRAEEPAAEA